MRFALSTAPQRTSWSRLLEIWQAADAISLFESAWTFDHFYPLFGDSTEDCLEGWITLTALLQATTRLRGGVLVSGMVYRHPALLANMATTLDITSGGRLEVGLGAGWNEEECAAYGIDLGTMSERFDRFEEGLAVIEALLTQDRTDFAGRYFTLTDAMNNPKPVQSPLPICIGGAGLRRTLPLAARYAHHWNYGSQTMSVADFRMRREVFNRACADVGRDPADVTISTMVRLTEADDAGFAAAVASAREFEEAGVDLAIVSIAKHLGGEAIAPLAEALAPLGGLS